MARIRDYQYQRIDRAREAQDDWYLQRRKDISEERGLYDGSAQRKYNSGNLISRKRVSEKRMPYKANDIKEIAWEIVQKDPDVLNALVFIHDIPGFSQQGQVNALGPSRRSHRFLGNTVG